jgi:hypothetical protein
MMENYLANKSFFWSRYQIFVQLHDNYNTKLTTLFEESKNKEGVSKSFTDHLKSKMKETWTSKEMDEKIADLSMKECHTIMIVGWEIDK